MKLTEMPVGYRVVGLRWTNGRTKRRNWLVHRLVALAFLGEPPSDRPYVNHKNFNTGDNRVENLEWVSPKQNVDHSNRAKRRSPASMVGTKNSNAVLTDADVRYIREQRANGISGLKLAKSFGISSNQVYEIGHRRAWKHVE